MGEEWNGKGNINTHTYIYYNNKQNNNDNNNDNHTNNDDNVYTHGVYPQNEWFIMNTPIKIHELRGIPFLGTPHILIIRIIHGNNNN